MRRRMRSIRFGLASVAVVINFFGPAVAQDDHVKRITTKAMGIVSLKTFTVVSETGASAMTTTNRTILVSIDETNQVAIAEEAGLDVTELKDDIERLRKFEGPLLVEFAKGPNFRIWVWLPSGEKHQEYPIVATSCYLRGKGRFVRCKATIQERSKKDLMLRMSLETEANAEEFEQIISGIMKGLPLTENLSQKHVVRVTYRVSSGERLSTIATSFSVSEAAILAANPGVNAESLVEGTALSIPVEE